jgi:hypothetical protein
MRKLGFLPHAKVASSAPHHYRLREGLADATSERLSDAYVRFFISATQVADAAMSCLV